MRPAILTGPLLAREGPYTFEAGRFIEGRVCHVCDHATDPLRPDYLARWVHPACAGDDHPTWTP